MAEKEKLRLDRDLAREVFSVVHEIKEGERVVVKAADKTVYSRYRSWLKLVKELARELGVELEG